jgi:beta-glucosidase
MAEPSAPYQNAALDVDQRVGDLLSRMTLVEKVRQMTAAEALRYADPDPVVAARSLTPKLYDGVGQITRPCGSAVDAVTGARFAREVQRYLVEESRLGIPAICHDEALSGFQAGAATQFPQSIGLAGTWQPELIEEMTTVIRRHMRMCGVHHALSPVLDVVRDARWGRVEETYGEDKYLVSRMAAAFVRGLQGDDPTTGVMATLKHFAGYSASEGGRNWAPVHLGWRELREIFLFPFEVAIREAGAQTVMNSYSEIDGIPANASRALLTGVLREEWGFDGLVVADYTSIGLLYRAHGVAEGPKEAAVLAVRAGMDTEFPSEHSYGAPLVEAVEEGLVSEGEIDELVRRVLTWKFRLGLFEHPYGDDPEHITLAQLDTDADRALARRLAEASIVLLKNDGVLPLDESALGSVAVIGPNADRSRGLLGDYAFTSMVESIAVMSGGPLKLIGSAAPQTSFDPLPVTTVREAIAARRVPVVFAPGCAVDDDDRSGFGDAVAAARDADVAVVVLGDQSGVIGYGTVGEGRDGATLALPGVQAELLEAVAATGTPVVVVLCNGRPFALERVDALAAAVVEAWFPGEEGGHAIASVLFGDVNPGGHLAVTLPRSAGHQPYSYDHKEWGAHDYADAPLAPVYPFGHGLSYTTFFYSALVVDPEVAVDGDLTVSCQVSNFGDRAGDDVVQLYIRDRVATVTRPVQELHGFARVSLEPGAAVTVTFTVPADRLAFWNADLRLAVEPGEHDVMVGPSCEDIRLQMPFKVVGDRPRIVDPAARALRSEVTVQPKR